MLRILAVAALVTLSLAACDTTRESWLAGLCNDAGHATGSADHGSCVEERRAADALAEDYWRKYHGYQ